jgi:GNAT superfamily N-acetyltransferase
MQMRHNSHESDGGPMVTIKEAVTKKDLKDFVKFPHTLYKDCPMWVPPLNFDEMATLDKKKNPAFDSCKAKYWLALKEGKIAGRIAGIINEKYIKVWEHKYARFGWVDFIDDPEVSGALFKTVEEWAADNGMEGIQGPLGFTDFDKEGMLIEGFDELGTIAGIYNYPYYADHMKALSYVKDADWLEFRIKLSSALPEKIERMSRIVARRFHLKTVPLRKTKDILPYTKEIFKLLNDCYKDLFGFVPLSDKQVAYSTKQYFSFIRPEFVQIITDKDDRLAGFGLTMPSLSLALQKTKGRLFPLGFLHLLRAVKKNDKADLLLIAVREDLQGKGVTAMIMREGYSACIRNGVTVVEASHELETNDKVTSIWKHLDARRHKKRRCFLKQFRQPAVRS